MDRWAQRCDATVPVSAHSLFAIIDRIARSLNKILDKTLCIMQDLARIG